MSTYRVVACDGGGIRGVFTARLIENLEADAGGFVSGIDLFAGTSIGSANALALAARTKPADIVRFYQEHGPKIFSKRIVPKGLLGVLAKLLEKLPRIRRYVEDADNLFLPKWDNTGLHEALAGFFGRTTLKELSHKVAVPALELCDNKPGWEKGRAAPVVMDNFENSRYSDTLAADAMQRSGAAPTYFASYQGFVDGGVVANNPSMAALAVALDPKKGNQPLQEVRMLSVGTGISPDRIAATQPLDWGILKWGPIIYDVSSTGVNEIDTLNARRVLQQQYCRLDLVLPEPIALDDASKIPRLIELADGMRGGRPYQAALEFVKTSFVSAR
jgi:patatin-like phospholipase/acyl hydrolase